MIVMRMRLFTYKVPCLVSIIGREICQSRQPASPKPASQQQARSHSESALQNLHSGIRKY